MLSLWYIGETEILKFVNTTIDQLDPLFMYSQLMKENPLEFPYDGTLKESIIDTWRQIYHHDQSKLSKIDEFQRNYRENAAIWWYTKDSCAFIELTMQMSFFINDINRQIAHEYSLQSIGAITRTDEDYWQAQFTATTDNDQHLPIVTQSLISTDKGKYTGAISFYQKSIDGVQ
ncbi:hypothetical protein I4U23_004614 [Adineta vaga]|nr:hypothetical protein I4U23_004614 [Adineta vaga]